MKKEKINKLFIEKFLSYDIHFGSPQLSSNFTAKPHLQGIRNGFCIIDLSSTHLYLRHSLRFLKKLFSQRKKILFIGSPKGLEKEFASLCSKTGHFWINSWSDGFFTNSEWFFNSKNKSALKIKERPCLIFIFDLSSYQKAKEEALRFEIPIMAFANSDETIENVDYFIPGNIKSWKGGLFIYNLFFHFLHLYRKN